MSAAGDGAPAPAAGFEAAATGFWDGPAEVAPPGRSRLLAVARIAAYVLLTLAMLPVQLPLLAARSRLAAALPPLHHRIGARILGLRVRREGVPVRGPGALFVVNHVSYFDIVALGSALSARFVAKREVRSWPGVSVLARLSRTVFIERRAAVSRDQVDELRRSLDAGERLIVFAEGTSTDGARVLPFKSTLFASVAGAGVTVQPVSIRYTTLEGVPMGRALRPLYAWYGDMDMAPHLMAALSRGAVGVSIRFHPPADARAFPDRKALARHCHALVAAGIEGRGALAGPEPPGGRDGPLDSAPGRASLSA